MYRAFNVTLKNIQDNNSLLQEGKVLYQKQKDIASKNLKKYISGSGILNGSMMQEDWFPSINADIFISHSHTDVENAIKLAAFLKSAFNITVFIDSCIWGNSNDLLKLIDDEYCFDSHKGTYSYKKRNISTSHVHMILSVALSKMIDKTECLFILNTPNSVSTSKTIETKTSSPWIYSEIAMAKMLKKPLRLHRENVFKSFSEGQISERKLQVEYELVMDEFAELNGTGLNNWGNRYRSQQQSGKTALDYLYDLYPSNLNQVNLIHGNK